MAEEQSFEPAEFRGLVFHDGVDALGRPVIVINADAVPPKVSRKAACTYMLQRLEPIVIQVRPPHLTGPRHPWQLPPSALCAAQQCVALVSSS